MPKMIIMRGIPGAGKTTYRKTHFPNMAVASADDFFMVNGEYRFDRAKLGDAHGACFREALEAVRCGFDVVVDNTNPGAVDIAPYAAMGQAFGYDVTVVTVVCDMVVAANRNVHSVPTDVIAKMQGIIQSEVLPPWWHAVVVHPTPLWKAATA